MHPLIQETGGDASVPLFVDAEHLVHHSTLPLARLRGDKAYWDALGLAKTFLNLLFHPFDCLFLVLVLY